MLTSRIAIIVWNILSLCDEDDLTMVFRVPGWRHVPGALKKEIQRHFGEPVFKRVFFGEEWRIFGFSRAKLKLPLFSEKSISKSVSAFDFYFFSDHPAYITLACWVKKNFNFLRFSLKSHTISLGVVTTPWKSDTQLNVLAMVELIATTWVVRRWSICPE